MTEKKLKVLFVCDLNRMRSPTAENLFSGHPRLEVQSAGVASTADKPLTPAHMRWADVVFVMEERQRRAIAERFGEPGDGTRVICLDIADEYSYMDPRLVELLQTRVLGNLAELEDPDTPGRVQKFHIQ